MGEIGGKIAESWQIYLGFFITWVLPFIIVFGAVWLGYRLRNPKNAGLNSELIEILKIMHQTTIKLKGEAYTQYISLFSFKDFLDLTNNVVIATNEQKEVLDDLNLKFKGKKIKKATLEKRQQIDTIFENLRPMLEQNPSLEEIVAFGNLLERLPISQNVNYRGIGELRKNNKQWNKLFKNLNDLKLKSPDIFSDESLDRMITDYINADFGGCSIYLFSEIVEWFVPVELLPSEYIKAGAHSFGINIETRMTRLLEDITVRIKTLTSTDRKANSDGIQVKPYDKTEETVNSFAELVREIKGLRISKVDSSTTEPELGMIFKEAITLTMTGIAEISERVSKSAETAIRSELDLPLTGELKEQDFYDQYQYDDKDDTLHLVKRRCFAVRNRLQDYVTEFSQVPDK